MPGRCCGSPSWRKSEDLNYLSQMYESNENFRHFVIDYLDANNAKMREFFREESWNLVTAMGTPKRARQDPQRRKRSMNTPSTPRRSSARRPLGDFTFNFTAGNGPADTMDFDFENNIRPQATTSPAPEVEMANSEASTPTNPPSRKRSFSFTAIPAREPAAKKPVTQTNRFFSTVKSIFSPVVSAFVESSSLPVQDEPSSKPAQTTTSTVSQAERQSAAASSKATSQASSTTTAQAERQSIAAPTKASTTIAQAERQPIAAPSTATSKASSTTAQAERQPIAAPSKVSSNVNAQAERQPIAARSKPAKTDHRSAPYLTKEQMLAKKPKKESLKSALAKLQDEDESIPTGNYSLYSPPAEQVSAATLNVTDEEIKKQDTISAKAKEDLRAALAQQEQESMLAAQAEQKPLTREEYLSEMSTPVKDVLAAALSKTAEDFAREEDSIRAVMEAYCNETDRSSAIASSQSMTADFPPSMLAEIQSWCNGTSSATSASSELPPSVRAVIESLCNRTASATTATEAAKTTDMPPPPLPSKTEAERIPGRLVKPTRETEKPKPAPTTIRIASLSQKLGSSMRGAPAPVSAKVKALEAAAKKKEADEKAAMEKAERKRELDRRRAAKAEQDRLEREAAEEKAAEEKAEIRREWERKRAARAEERKATEDRDAARKRATKAEQDRLEREAARATKAEQDRLEREAADEKAAEEKAEIRREWERKRAARAEERKANEERDAALIRRAQEATMKKAQPSVLAPPKRPSNMMRKASIAQQLSASQSSHPSQLVKISNARIPFAEIPNPPATAQQPSYGKSITGTTMKQHFSGKSNPAATAQQPYSTESKQPAATQLPYSTKSNPLTPAQHQLYARHNSLTPAQHQLYTKTTPVQRESAVKQGDQSVPQEDEDPNDPKVIARRHRFITPTRAFQDRSELSVHTKGSNISLPTIFTDSEDEDYEPYPEPEWAAGPVLNEILKNQQLRDPETVFGAIPKIDVERVFRNGKNNERLRKLKERDSSAAWIENGDALTSAEKRKDKMMREKIVRDGKWTFDPSA